MRYVSFLFGLTNSNNQLFNSESMDNGPSHFQLAIGIFKNDEGETIKIYSSLEDKKVIDISTDVDESDVIHDLLNNYAAICSKNTESFSEDDFKNLIDSAFDEDDEYISEYDDYGIIDGPEIDHELGENILFCLYRSSEIDAISDGSDLLYNDNKTSIEEIAGYFEFGEMETKLLYISPQ